MKYIPNRLACKHACLFRSVFISVCSLLLCAQLLYPRMQTVSCRKQTQTLSYQYTADISCRKLWGRVLIWHRRHDLRRIICILPTYLSICQSRKGQSRTNLHLFEVALLIHAKETWEFFFFEEGRLPISTMTVWSCYVFLLVKTILLSPCLQVWARTLFDWDGLRTTGCFKCELILFNQHVLG